MAENTQSQPANSGVATTPLSAGQSLPLFKRTGRPSPFSMEDLNRLVTAINGFIRLKIVRLSSTSADGTVQPASGTLTLSDDSSILTLYDASGGAGGGSVTTPMTVVTEFSNYLQCTDANNNTVYVAKPYLLRASVYVGTRMLFDGLNHAFLSTGVNTRTDTVTLEGTPVVFQQLILDQYFVNDILQCTQPAGGTGLLDGSGNPILWQDTNEDARGWATEFPACITIAATVYNGYQLIVGSDWYPTSIAP